MIWFVSLALLTGGPIPDQLTSRVREAVAAVWQVPAERITVEWGLITTTAEIPTESSFRLLGTGQGGRFVVVVRSAARDVAVTLKAGRRDSVWVATRPLPARTVVGPADAARAEQTVFGPPDDQPASPFGLETRRTVAAGEALTPAVVLPPIVIQSGERVQFALRTGAIVVAREGVALNRARRGESVWGRDASSGARVRGIAEGPGQARLIGEGRRP